MSDGNGKRDDPPQKTTKKDETSADKDDIDDDDAQQSGDDTVKDNNNSNDIIGAVDAKTASNANRRFGEVNYTFELNKLENEDDDSKATEVPAVAFNGIMYSSFKELKKGLLSGMFGKGDEAKHVFETLVAALGTVSDEGIKSRNSSRRLAVIDDDDNYEERRNNANGRRSHGVSLVSYFKLFFIFLFIILLYF